MGFMDKARKMAEQAQAKLDEVQKQFNEGQGGAQHPQSQAPVEYDQHGRPVNPPTAAAEPSAPPAAATPPHGDPLAGSEPAPTPAPDPATPPATATPPHGDPLAAAAPPAPGAPGTGGTASPPPEPGTGGAASSPPAPGDEPSREEEKDRNDPGYAPPKLSGGDPLAG